MRQVWDSQTLECLRTLEGHEDNVRVLAVGERYVFSGSWDKSIRCAHAHNAPLGVHASHAPSITQCLGCYPTSMVTSYQALPQV